MSEPRAKSFNYAIGFFGMSIPINMLKTFAFTFYVLQRGVTTTQWATMMLIYAFIDALDLSHVSGVLPRFRGWRTERTPEFFFRSRAVHGVSPGQGSGTAAPRRGNAESLLDARHASAEKGGPAEANSCMDARLGSRFSRVAGLGALTTRTRTSQARR